MDVNAPVHIPGVGAVQKRYVYIGAGILILAVGATYYRRSHAASNAGTAAAADTNIDPATGYGYGTAEDAAALAALQAGTAATAGASGGGGGSQYTPVPGTGLSTNAQWTQAVLDYVSNTLGQDAAPMASALGAYLAGQKVTPAQSELIHQAIAEEGAPPVAAADGYPPNLRLMPVTPTPPGTGAPTIHPGEQLKIPYNVAPGQAARVAARFGISLAHLLAENPGKTGHENTTQQYIVPFEVKAGMTVASIAAQFGISTQHLAQYLPA